MRTPKRGAGDAGRIDSQRTDSQRTDSRRTDSQRTDSQRTDSQRTDSQRTDSQRTDSQRTDSQRTDARRTDARRTDARRTDARRTDARRTDARRAPSSLPLRNVTVLDLTRVLSGPFCTMQLADLGATVWKVESLRGDDARHFRAAGDAHEPSLYFSSVNRNKSSLAIDLKRAEGQRLVRALARRADVVVENFRPGVAARLGLDARTLRRGHGALVHLSLSGFGQTGRAEDVRAPGYDVVVQGLSGVQWLTGEPDGPALRAGVPIADLVAGHVGAQAVLAALLERARSGRGAALDVSMLEATSALLAYQAVAALAGTAPTRRVGNAHASIAPYGCYDARDGAFNLAVGNDAQFAALCRLLGVRWHESPDFATNPARARHRRRLDALLARAFRRRARAFWLAAFARAGLPAGPVSSLPEAVAHPQHRARGFVVDAGGVRQLGSPLPQARVRHAPAPRLGADTRRVLARALGLTRDALERLALRGVIGP